MFIPVCLSSSSVDALAEMSVKAFELVPAVERDLLMGDKARINIECIECCGKHLYVGTNDCFIHHFLLDEVTSSKGKPCYSALKLLHKYLGLKKPVAELRAASALERLIVLCEGIVFLVDMVTLETVPSAAGGGAKIRGVTAFCVNENPVSGDPFCVEMAVLSSKRRTVQIYMVYEDRVQLVKEMTTPEQPCAVSLDGYFLCLALATQYVILNYNTGASQDLFPYNSEERRPIVKRISREEFLLAAPGGLGKLVPKWSIFRVRSRFFIIKFFDSDFQNLSPPPPTCRNVCQCRGGISASASQLVRKCYCCCCVFSICGGFG